ncbi:Acetylornithine/succinyldiaminopimelate/putrescine aminotransferase [Robiginitalea myxolifaciens]|uniref:Acetylornithine/succinyldiaminopimelate/putrescine aminotransferase n=1 Tax=Robiginitalea myxolifaciens TaxID=400055 RepID=A0A1I6FNH9_9FLAO|nr:aminotransferase class III-fold pyridoxal phosphate-dependent enzyme [Robiginitalea myxolifaciens]SFR31495.1 Acetylornithine/succinyldiaminopimelate/putrescine aminotransferase [Robiginitalea myxolifaciens]
MNPDFRKYQAQTGPYPMGLEVDRADGSYIYDKQGKAYLDFVAGVSACTLGHCHPKVVEAIQEQSSRYMHVMVYGEFVLEPALDLCRRLAALLPDPLDSTYLVNSGTEAMEGALKLARRVTGRKEILAAKDAYHGNTLGSLSLMSMEERMEPFRPLLPGVDYIAFNDFDALERIGAETAAVVLETIQGGAGFIEPTAGYLKAVRDRCDAVGALLILDEIQPGFGRTGKLFAFEHYGIVPDVLVMGKGMASGLPVGAFTASHEHMRQLSENPSLGHITTFGGNPVIAAAARATLEALYAEKLIEQTLEKEALFRELLVHDTIQEVRGRGLMLALMLPDPATTNYLVTETLKRGLILFWLLFEPRAVRLTPPLTISKKEIREGCSIILELLDNYRPVN